MLAGIPLLALAFGTILGTIVVIARTDTSGLDASSAPHRLWLILTAWLWEGNPEVYRKRYAFVLPGSSAILYWCAFALDAGYQSTLGTAGYFAAARLIAIPGGVFGFCGVGYNIMYMAHSLRDRTWLQFFVFLFLIPASVVLQFLHLFALIGLRPPVPGWS
ncbi:MAG: hypothetical protein HN404_00695 [Gemmatimonadetes bacterium]|nr:hypothetical protein [Gemmatimonadota bacterium]